MSIADGFRSYLRDFGVRGLVTVSSHRLCGFPRTMKAMSPILRGPVKLRVRTTDVSVFGEIILRQEYNFGLPAHADVIVDAGANIGLASIFYATKFPNARILALEAEESNFRAMLENVRAYPSITPIHAALWHRDGQIRVNAPMPGAFGKWGFFVSDDPGEVRSITVLSLMREFGFDKIDLFKIDIEGAEKEVFEKCDWQSRIGSFVIELHDRFKLGCSKAVNLALLPDFDGETCGELTVYRKRSQARET